MEVNSIFGPYISRKFAWIRLRCAQSKGDAIINFGIYLKLNLP